MGKEKEYEFCIVCKKNHSEGRRHVYSKHHQERLKHIISKDLKEISKLKFFLQDVVIVDDPNKQPDFWCRFCKEEVVYRSDSPVIICSHVFEHLASKHHRTSVDNYWKKHNPDKKEKHNFILEPDVLVKFKQEANLKLDQFRNNQKKEEEETLKEQIQKTSTVKNFKEEIELPKAFKTLINEFGVLQNPTGWHEGKRVWGGGVVKDKNADWIPWQIDLDEENQDSYLGEQGSNTITNSKQLANYGEALTSIRVPELLPGEKNVHDPTSVPPWLMPTTSEETTIEYGPSISDFEKAKLLSQKKKLNPNRIGANFDHDKEVDSNWLPLFGRVWGESSRSQERKNFKRSQ